MEYKKYDGWIMHTPEVRNLPFRGSIYFIFFGVAQGSFKFTVGAGQFEKVIKQYGGVNALQEWRDLNVVLKPIVELSGAIPPLALRCDLGNLITFLPHFPNLLKSLTAVPKVEGSFADVCKDVVKDKFLLNWFNFLSFALSGLPADSTIAAAVA